MATAPPLSDSDSNTDLGVDADADASGSYGSDAESDFGTSEVEVAIQLPLPLQTQPSQQHDECIICLDPITKECNFRSDFCTTCMYNVHTQCIEDFIEYQRRMHHIHEIKCILCSRIVDRHQRLRTAVEIINLNPNIQDIQVVSIQSILTRQRQRRNNRRRIYSIISAIFCVLLLFSALIYFLSTLKK